MYADAVEEKSLFFRPSPSATGGKRDSLLCFVVDIGPSSCIYCMCCVGLCCYTVDAICAFHSLPPIGILRWKANIPGTDFSQTSPFYCLYEIFLFVVVLAWKTREHLHFLCTARLHPCTLCMREPFYALCGTQRENTQKGILIVLSPANLRVEDLISVSDSDSLLDSKAANNEMLQIERDFCLGSFRVPMRHRIQPRA